MIMHKAVTFFSFHASVLALAVFVYGGFSASSPAFAQGQPVSLTVTNEAVPDEAKDNIYPGPISVREIRPEDLTGQAYYEPTRSLVTQKIDSLDDSVKGLRANMKRLIEDYDAIQGVNEGRSAEYFAAVATINTQLQSGTTPGNPRLVERLKSAEKTLQYLMTSMGELNQIAIRATQIQSQANYLSEEVRSTFRISGAIEEDHKRLSDIEDRLDGSAVALERVLDNVSDDVTRLGSYLSAERANLRTLSLAVANGDLYGRSLSERPFSSVSAFVPAAPGQFAAAPTGQARAAATPSPLAPLAPNTTAQETTPPSTLPLVKIRFNQPNVNYEQPVYNAINEALERYPNAQFELVAVHPTKGNAAQVAIQTTKARRNGERVLRTVTQMGLAPERVNLSYDESAEAASTEVHIYIR